MQRGYPDRIVEEQIHPWLDGGMNSGEGPALVVVGIHVAGDVPVVEASPIVELSPRRAPAAGSVAFVGNAVEGGGIKRNPVGDITLIRRAIEIAVLVRGWVEEREDQLEVV